jgi:hypothetical protein
MGGEKWLQGIWQLGPDSLLCANRASRKWEAGGKGGREVQLGFVANQDCGNGQEK